MVLAQQVTDEELELSDEFPSHYGSRSTLEDLETEFFELCFHPTMVLAQQRESAGN